jgi:hypothetical protein
MEHERLYLLLRILAPCNAGTNFKTRAHTCYLVSGLFPEFENKFSRDRLNKRQNIRIIIPPPPLSSITYPYHILLLIDPFSITNKLFRQKKKHIK